MRARVCMLRRPVLALTLSALMIPAGALPALGQDATPAPNPCADVEAAIVEAGGRGMAGMMAGTPRPGGMMGGPGMMMDGTPGAGMAGMGQMDPAQMGRMADVMFIDMMVPHHAGAIAMARVALERAEREEVRELAEEIIAAQEAEIAEFRALRERLYPDMPPMPMDQMPGMMQGMMDQDQLPMMQGTPGMGPGGMPAMDPVADLEALCAATGPFDLAFVEAMIPHHQGAIRVAEMVLLHTRTPEIRDLAEGIIDAQTAEIAEMEAWRAEWSGEATPTP